MTTTASTEALVREIVARLEQQTHGRLPRVVIAETVEQSLADLSPVAPDAVPEMLERLARQRLSFLQDPSAWQG